jgi:hypothetical protein
MAHGGCIALLKKRRRPVLLTVNLIHTLLPKMPNNVHHHCHHQNYSRNDACSKQQTKEADPGPMRRMKEAIEYSAFTRVQVLVDYKYLYKY